MNASISVALDVDFHVSQSSIPAPAGSTSNNSAPATATPRPAQGALHDIYVVHITTLLGERYFVKCHSQTLIHHLKKRMSNELLGYPAPWQQTWVLQQQTLLPCDATVGDVVKRLQLASATELPRGGRGVMSMGSSLGSGSGNPALEVQKVDSDSSRHNDPSTATVMMALRDRDAPTTRHASPGPNPAGNALAPPDLVALDTNSKEIKMEAIFAPLPISPNLSTAHPSNGTTTYTSSTTAAERVTMSVSTTGRRLSGSGTGQGASHHGTEHHLYVRVIRNMQTNGPALSSPEGAPTCEWCSRVVKPPSSPPRPEKTKARNGQQQHTSSSNSHSGSDDEGKAGGKRHPKDAARRPADLEPVGTEHGGVPKRPSNSRLPGIPVVASETLISSDATGSAASLVNASVITHSSSDAGSPMVPVASGSHLFNQVPPAGDVDGSLPKTESSGVKEQQQQPTPPGAPSPPGNPPPRKLPSSMFHKRESPPELPNFLQVE